MFETLESRQLMSASLIATPVSVAIVAPKPGSTVSLNPQPLPPGGTVSLNPQPLPPGGGVSLNPQPLPPKVSFSAVLVRT